MSSLAFHVAAPLRVEPASDADPRMAPPCVGFPGLIRANHTALANLGVLRGKRLSIPLSRRWTPLGYVQSGASVVVPEAGPARQEAGHSEGTRLEPEKGSASSMPWICAMLG